MKRKLAILILIILCATLSLVGGVYGWIIAPSTGIDMNIRSSELFTARMSASIGTNQIDYNDSFYNVDDLSIKMTKSQIQSNTSNNVMPLKIDIIVTPLKNVRVKIKLVETYTNNQSVVITRPLNALTFSYNTTSLSAETQDGYRIYNNEILKDTTVTIPFITQVGVNVNNIPNNTTVKITAVVVAVQANRVEVWNNSIPYVQMNLNNVNGATVEVKFNGVANQQFGRGVYIEFIPTSGTNKYSYTWNNRVPLTDKLTLANATYRIYINLTNYIKFTVSYTSSKLTINVSYDTNATWGYEDVLFSPHTIANWTYGVQYTTGDVVYFDDPDDPPNDQSGFYIAVQNSNQHRPDQNSWAWRLMGPYYQSGTQFTAGTIIFFNGVFYKAKSNTWGSPTSDANAWERLDRYYSNTNSYPAGAIVFLEDSQGKRTYYYATANIATYQPPASWSNWKTLGRDFSEINAGGKYQAGEIVYYNNNYWRVTSSGQWLSAPATNKSGWALITTPNPQNWSPSTNYAQWAYVTWNNKFYYNRNTSNLGNEPGTANNGWQELTDTWVATNIYRNPSNNTIKELVWYGGNMYVWNGADNSNSTTPPGTGINGWQEITELWKPGNQYFVGDRVIYDGSLWEALQSPYDNGVPIIPGTNFTVWKEYQIIWDPNRS